jgi:hypothetical protein
MVSVLYDRKTERNAIDAADAETKIIRDFARFAQMHSFLS